jgi:dihydrolipoamide dehydrogenase
VNERNCDEEGRHDRHRSGVPDAALGPRHPGRSHPHGDALGRTDGLTKILLDPETDAVLGVGIVGPGAGELIAEGVLAIEMGCSARDLVETIHPHPTLGETVAFSAENYFGLATEIYRPKSESSAR